MKPTDTAVERGSGNVFADLGFPDADAHLVKADLVSRIDDIVRDRGLTQTEAARLMGLSQPDVSRLLRGDFREYSLERLLRLLNALGRDIDIIIRKPSSADGGRLRIAAAEPRLTPLPPPPHRGHRECRCVMVTSDNEMSRVFDRAVTGAEDGSNVVTSRLTPVVDIKEDSGQFAITAIRVVATPPSALNIGYGIVNRARKLALVNRVNVDPAADARGQSEHRMPNIPAASRTASSDRLPRGNAARTPHPIPSPSPPHTARQARGHRCPMRKTNRSSLPASCSLIAPK